MTFECKKLRDAARGQICVRCGGETWKPIVGFEGAYEVSCLGRVRSLERQRKFKSRWGTIGVTIIRARLLTPNWVGKGRYAYVHLYCGGKRTRMPIYVHHAVLEAFVGPRPSNNHEACHGPDGCFDNRLSNLRWDTSEANDADVIREGKQKGESNPRSKLTADSVVSIRTRRAAGESVASIANDFGISNDYVYTVAQGKSWGHIP